MKILMTTLALSIMMIISSSANAILIGFKDWEFRQTNQSWNEIARQYDSVSGQLKCNSGYGSCPFDVWASEDEVNKFLSVVNLQDLYENMFPSLPTFMGERPSFCNKSECLWHGWLRDEDPSDSTQALSVIFGPSSISPLSMSPGGLTYSFLPKIFKDEGGQGGPAITGHFVFTRVDSPSIFVLLVASICGFVMARRKY